MGPPEGKVTNVEQGVYPVPDIPIKDLLGAIPAHCFQRSALRSLSYLVWDAFVIGCFYKATTYLDALIDTPNFLHYTFLKVALWSLYGFWAGLFGTGLWVIGHECGHQSFSESKTINNTVGWIVHSALGVPYYSWRITHAKHHASTGHMTQDQVFVPHTRSDLGLKPLNPAKEDQLGSWVVEEVMKEMWEALGDSPVGAILGSAGYVLGGWPAYILKNMSGQPRYPKDTNHFNPSSPMFAPHQYGQIMISTVGVLLWLTGLSLSFHKWGFLTVFKTYLVPYLWVNHWLVLITFLQHTDPLLPHYRASEFTFVRGALTTLDRSLMGDLGIIMGWIGAHATNGISETHILHHVSSKIPHYHAWEASRALKKKLSTYGIPTEGRPVGWCELMRVFKLCKFVEDEGDVVFFKNAYGLAEMRPLLPDSSASDSGIEIDNKS